MGCFLACSSFWIVVDIYSCCLLFLVDHCFFGAVVFLWFSRKGFVGGICVLPLFLRLKLLCTARCIIVDGTSRYGYRLVKSVND